MSAPGAAGAAFAAGWDALPEALRAQRRAAWTRFRATGLPDKEIEEWRYTDLASLAAIAFDPAAALDRAAANDALSSTPLAGFVSRTYVNGRAEPAAKIDSDPIFREIDSDPIFLDGVTALNAALARDGALLHFAANREHAPVHLRSWLGGTRSMAHLRHVIRLDANARATVLIESLGDASEGLATSVCEVELGPGAQLDLVRIQDLGDGASELARTQVRLDRDATLRYAGLDLGGRIARHDLDVLLDGRGSAVHLDGVIAAAGASHCDTHTHVVHASPHATSRERYRALASGKSRVIFNGKVTVKPGAVKTDSGQNVASLLLSPQAEVNAKPELEIHNDDVKCAHGAAIGALDATALHYLRTRGVPLDEARRLLIKAFAHAALDDIRHAALQEFVHARLDARLRERGDGA